MPPYNIVYMPRHRGLRKRIADGHECIIHQDNERIRTNKAPHQFSYSFIKIAVHEFFTEDGHDLVSESKEKSSPLFQVLYATLLN